ncbi:tetratricopeptide repeat-containing sensor histidine kinase [Maribacter sp. ANRC-HE7]|uniref:histidine kinase n=1 Tax=Maribacter aquimaris TaxID=2737171 RepID=A0ABR7UVS4_9FLAO|nr:tetratricopeptide repeat protein [Maribacter aquimaris]MBD0776197.1 tetratricopeptide repeat-containing sensor histidine kinase [Maribacter aquimaris]
MRIKQISLLNKLVIAFVVLLTFGFGQVQSQVPRRDSLQFQIQRLKSKSDFNPKDSTYITLLNDLGGEIRYFNSDSLYLLSKEAYAHSSSADYEYGQSSSLVGIGNYYEDQGNYDEAIKYYQKALKIVKNSNHRNDVLNIENSIANVYYYQGDYAESLSRNLKNLELASELGNDMVLSIINENIAGLYADQNDFEQAIQFFKIVKKINKKIGDDINSAETMSNLASVYSDMDELEYAMYNINSSIAIFEKHKIMDWLAFAYQVKGKTYLKAKDYKWALYWYKQSEMLHKNIEDNRGETSLLNGIAESYLGRDKDDLAEEYALKAFEISKQIRFHEEMLNSARILYQTNKKKGDYKTALDYHELFQTLHDTITTNKNKKSLTMLVTKIDFEKQKEQLITENEKALASQKIYIYLGLLVLVIFLIITLIVKRNEKIQKKLNIELYDKTAKLVENEKELREINETKDKLFSIIGHDLRGPIGAFQGLLQLYKNGEIDSKDFLQFIPKLRSDIDNISFTLNNLLSWGRTQMNGSTTKPSIVSLENLVQENINLLEETAKVKSIRIKNKVKVNTLCWSDSDHIDIVIRNLLSNAIKFTPEGGQITINADEHSTSWEISVRDTGVGIDAETQKKLFNKNSNITTYGTNDEKGTGLGLSLCMELVKKNKGKIWVESVIPNGSCFYFKLPKMKNKLQKTG